MERVAPGVSARRMRAEASRIAAKNVNHKKARRRKESSGMGAIMSGVCAGFEEKPMAQWDWEVQDRGSRTKNTE